MEEVCVGEVAECGGDNLIVETAVVDGNDNYDGLGDNKISPTLKSIGNHFSHNFSWSDYNTSPVK